MKKTVSLLVITAFLAAGLISCGKKNPELPAGEATSSKRTAEVTASTNLVIRTQPNRTATKLGVAGHGAIVEVLQDGDKEENIGGITSRWYRVSYNGVEGWVFGGYLRLSGGAAPSGNTDNSVAATAPSSMTETLKEESDPRNYVGKEYLNLDPALKSRMISMIAVGSNLMTVALKYNGKAVVILQKKTGMSGASTRWLVTDVQPLAFNDKKEMLFFPSSCAAKKIAAPIMAVARDVQTDCEYTKIIAAWTIDESTGRFSPAMTGGITCRPDSCGE